MLIILLSLFGAACADASSINFTLSQTQTTDGVSGISLLVDRSANRACILRGNNSLPSCTHTSIDLLEGPSTYQISYLSAGNYSGDATVISDREGTRTRILIQGFGNATLDCFSFRSSNWYTIGTTLRELFFYGTRAVDTRTISAILQNSRYNGVSLNLSNDKRTCLYSR
jgi:hypothetical protein